MCICINGYILAALFLTLIIINGASIYNCDQKLAFTIVLSCPQFDFASDIAYLITEKFHNRTLLIACILSLSHSFFAFIYRLYTAKALVPRLLLWNPNEIIVLSYSFHGDPIPIPNIKRKPLPKFENNSSIAILFIIALTWIVAILFQLLYWAVFLLINVLYLSFVPFWFLVGVFLKMTKLLAIREVWNMYFSVWLGPKRYEYLKQTGAIDTGELNTDMCQEFAFETIPQVSTIVSSLCSPNYSKFTY
jgi:hypothetical protein